MFEEVCELVLDRARTPWGIIRTLTSSEIYSPSLTDTARIPYGR
jgi:hypothetical protein